MLQVQSQARPWRVQNDLLAQAMERLERAMAADVPGSEREWAAGTGDALAGMDAILRKHATLAEGPDGAFSAVDLTRPTLARRVAKLRREHRMFLVQVRDLRARIEQAASAFEAPSAAANSPDLPEPEAPDGVADFGARRHELAEFLDALQRHYDCENSLVIESVTTDLGAGD
jgi:hypothetical protein